MFSRQWPRVESRMDRSTVTETSEEGNHISTNLAVNTTVSPWFILFFFTIELFNFFNISAIFTLCLTNNFTSSILPYNCKMLSFCSLSYRILCSSQVFNFLTRRPCWCRSNTRNWESLFTTTYCTLLHFCDIYFTEENCIIPNSQQCKCVFVVWPVGAIIQCPLQPLDWGSLERVGHQRNQMSGQATAAFCTHGVPLVGHSTGTWKRSGQSFRLRHGLQFKSAFEWANVPICSFSKGSSISFRLASRWMSVQIYSR